MTDYIWYVYALVAMLQVFDAVLTYTILDRGGRELNAVMKTTMSAIGVMPALLLWKAFFLALLAVCTYYGPAEFMIIVLALIAIGYVWLGVHNWSNL